ncbi:MAG: hypothetical protein LCH32_04115 [Bacteroidetes bacterium]|nr:hypothetical protein [Bacteroidota bacterium]
MKRIFKYIVILYFIVLKINAQSVTVNAVLDSTKIRIGEQVKLHLYVMYDANITPKLNIEWPQIGDTITENIDVVSVSAIDTTIPDKTNPGRIQMHQQFIISPFDSGYQVIPAFKFKVNNDTTNLHLTPTLMLEVHTVPTDSSLTKTKDIKPLFTEEFNWIWYKNHIIAGSLILIAICTLILIYRYIRKNKKPIVVIEEGPKIPAHIKALEALEKIKSEKIWTEGKSKEYYSQIADTIRLYLEDRYEVPALESTTDEIMFAMKSQVIDNLSKEKLQQILQFSDLVKFAKMTPVEQQNEQILLNAFEFVNGTKREIITEKQNTNT